MGIYWEQLTQPDCSMYQEKSLNSGNGILLPLTFKDLNHFPILHGNKTRTVGIILPK